jgi:hypothetical protein
MTELQPSVRPQAVLTAGKLSADQTEESPIQLSRDVQADFFGSKQNSISFPHCCLGVHVRFFRKSFGI